MDRLSKLLGDLLYEGDVAMTTEAHGQLMSLLEAIATTPHLGPTERGQATKVIVTRTCNILSSLLLRIYNAVDLQQCRDTWIGCSARVCGCFFALVHIFLPLVVAEAPANVADMTNNNINTFQNQRTSRDKDEMRMLAACMENLMENLACVVMVVDDHHQSDHASDNPNLKLTATRHHSRLTQAVYKQIALMYELFALDPDLSLGLSSALNMPCVFRCYAMHVMGMISEASSMAVVVSSNDDNTRQAICMRICRKCQILTQNLRGSLEVTIRRAHLVENMPPPSTPQSPSTPKDMNSLLVQHLVLYMGSMLDVHRALARFVAERLANHTTEEGIILAHACGVVMSTISSCCFFAHSISIKDPAILLRCTSAKLLLGLGAALMELSLIEPEGLCPTCCTVALVLLRWTEFHYLHLSADAPLRDLLALTHACQQLYRAAGMFRARSPGTISTAKAMKAMKNLLQPMTSHGRPEGIELMDRLLRLLAIDCSAVHAKILDEAHDKVEEIVRHKETVLHALLQRSAALDKSVQLSA
jgi:hypothetical protein